MLVKQEPSATLQQQLKVLIKSRKQIVDKISILMKRRHFLVMQPKNKLTQEQEAEPNGNPRKIAKLESQNSIQSQQMTPKKQQRIRSSTNLSKQQQGEPENIKKLKQQQLKRNKRLFGGLNSHLDKAKIKIDQQKNKREETNKILQKAQQKERQISQKIIKQELDKINNQLAAQQKLKSENSKQVLKIQNLILLHSYTQYANTIKPFAFTRAEPSISWKPTKQIQIVAKKWLGARQQEIQEKNRKIIQSIQNYENKFDFSLYLLQNECQYYKNYLKNFYHQTQQFFITEHQPLIFWKPNQEFDKLNQLKLQSKKRVQEVIQNNQKKCEDYYSQKISVLKQRRQKGQADEGESGSQSPQKQEQD